MGLMTTLLKLSDGKAETKGNAPGKSALCTGEGYEGQTVTAEVYQAPGVFGIPPDGARGVMVPIGGSSRYGVIVGTHNYQIEIDVGGPGGMAIYSTNTAGDEVKASVIVKPDGKIIITGDSIEINGDSKKFVTYAELNTALQSHTHGAGALLTGPTSGSPVTGTTGAPVGLDLSAAETSTVKTGG